MFALVSLHIRLTREEMEVVSAIAFNIFLIFFEMQILCWTQ